LYLLAKKKYFSYGVKRGDTGDGISGLKLLTVTINLLRKRRQMLLLPITMFIGLEEAFLAVDFTRVSGLKAQLRHQPLYLFPLLTTVVCCLRLGNF